MKPKVILYTAVSLDGRTTGFSVDLELFYSLVQRWGEGASLVGCDTLLNVPGDIPEDDDSEAPAATPVADDSRPILVVPDSRGRLRTWSYWRQQPYWRDFISLCTTDTPANHVVYLKSKGIKVIIAGTKHVDFSQAFDALSRKFGITVVRVDSGGTLNGALLRAGLVDELHLLVHPTLVGGASQRTFYRDPNPGQSSEIALRFLGSELQANGILLLSYTVTV